MNRIIFLKTIILISFLLTFQSIYSQQTNEIGYIEKSTNNNKFYQNWLDAGISAIPGFIPGGSLYILKYGRKIDPKDDFIFGLCYMKQGNPYPGTLEAYQFILAYRRYVWNNLHLEYQIIPGYASYFDTNANTNPNGFIIWNELRLGYSFDFKILEIVFFINPQIAAGFYIYRPKAPQSFIDKDGWDNLLFHLFPDITIGLRF